MPRAEQKSGTNLTFAAVLKSKLSPAMALMIYGYDLVCFAVVAGAILAALWVIGQREGDQKCGDASKYESLLGVVGSMQNGDLGPSRLWMCCWKGVHPGWLLATRAVSGIVMAGFLAWDIRCYDLSIFVYYTEWSFTLVIIYFLLGTIISAHGCWIYSKRQMGNEERNSGTQGTDIEDPMSTITTCKQSKIRGSLEPQSYLREVIIEEKANFLVYLMQAIYQASTGSVMLTDIVFWCIIVPFLSIQHFSLNVLMGSMHSINAVCLLLDTVLNSMPFPWFRLAYFVLLGCIYIVFQWVIHACGFSWWPYPFLELSTPWAPLWYLCLALVHIPCYGLCAFITDAKSSIFSRLFPQAYVKLYN